MCHLDSTGSLRESPKVTGLGALPPLPQKASLNPVPHCYRLQSNCPSLWIPEPVLIQEKDTCIHYNIPWAWDGWQGELSASALQGSGNPVVGAHGDRHSSPCLFFCLSGWVVLIVVHAISIGKECCHSNLHIWRVIYIFQNVHTIMVPSFLEARCAGREVHSPYNYISVSLVGGQWPVLRSLAKLQIGAAYSFNQSQD
jgi:hypothetical protein